MSNIRKNYIYNVSFQIFSLLTPLITAPYISRVLGPEGTGTFSYIHSIATYFSLLAALGLSSYGLREVSRVRDNPKRTSRLFYELTIIRLVTTLISFLLYMGFVWISGGETALYLGTGFVILSVGVDCTWFFQALEKFKSLMVRNFLIKFLSIVCIFLFVKTEEDLLLYTIIQTGSIFLSNLALFPQLRKLLVAVPWRRMRFGRHLKETLVYFIPTIATSVYTVLDRTMIGVITQDMAENGFYEQAHKIINILLTVITSLNVVVGVRTSYLFGKNQQDEIRRHIRDTFRFMYMLSFPLCAGLVACADLFAPEFFGHEFTQVAPMLKLFAPLLFIIGTSNVLGNLYLTPGGRRALSNRAVIAGACTNLVLNLLLIPSWGAYGAVAASVAAELVISALYLRYSHSFISAWQLLGMAVRYAAYAAVMFVPTYLVGQVLPAQFYTVFVQVAVGAVTYAGLLILFRDPTWQGCKQLLLKKLHKNENVSL
ncbi:MAG: flippase [Clostridia bacterium]|nr:flippase [Clostridia bacterium]